MDRSGIARRLREARINAGFRSATDAANAVSVSVPTYIGHENGARLVRAEPAERYADAFGVSLTWLLTGKGVMRPEEIELSPPRLEPHEVESALRGDQIPEVDSELRPSGKSWVFPAGFAPLVLGVPTEGLVAMACRGQQADETGRRNERVFVDTRHRIPSPDGVYAIKGMLGGVEFCRLQSSRSRPGKVSILTGEVRQNVEEVDASEVVIIGKVVCALQLT